MLDLLETPGPFLVALDGFRWCSRCGECKPIDDFPMKVEARGLRRVWCRDCCRAYGREHYRKNRQTYLEKNVRRRSRERPRVRASIDAYLRAHPCVDCGCADITVLEFDHRDPAQKDLAVGELARYHEWPRVLAEIEKCDVRCVNCHRKRTAAQFNWAKERGIAIDPLVVRPGTTGRYARLTRPLQLRLLSNEPHGLRRCSRCRQLKPITEFALRHLLNGVPAHYCRDCKAAHRRKHYQDHRDDYMSRAKAEARLKREDVLLRVFEYLRAHPCVDCGETDLRVLEFDHIDSASKTMNVTAMIGRRSWRAISAEITKCHVRCGNCHRKRTAAQQAWKCRLAETSPRYRRIKTSRVWRSGSAQPSQG